MSKTDEDLEEIYKNEYKIKYKVIYPNGKIYIGSDYTDNISYFGSISPGLLKKDFNRNQMKFFSITQEILFETIDIKPFQLRKMEKEYIIKYQSNNPLIGYNQMPKFV